MQTIFNRILEALEGDQECAVATVVATHGSVPRDVGAKMLIFKDGSTEGTIGGGSLEQRVIADAKVALKRKQSFSKDYPLDKKSGFQVCGGKVTVFIDALSPSKQLVICGAGHIGLALSFMAKLLGFHVTIVDNRRSFANKERFPHADRIICKNYPKGLKKLFLNKNTLVVIVTHQHQHDQECLEVVLRRDAAYVGMIGSRAKIKHNFGLLLKKGFTKKELAKIHAPIGLDIGAESPEEIAVAIAGELIKISRSEI